MGEQTMQGEATLIAELNDLLRLDHDAVQAYTLAIRSIDNPAYRETLERFRGDHERHIDELTRLIRNHGGTPVELPHLSTGGFKLAVQGAAALGGDRAVLLAFKANERQVRDKYRRSAEREHPPEVGVVLSRAAGDEMLHYAWALEALEDLGAGSETTLGRIENAFEVAHGRVADTLERAEERAMEGADRVKRGVKGNPLGAALIAVGAGILASRFLGGRDLPK